MPLLSDEEEKEVTMNVESKAEVAVPSHLGWVGARFLRKHERGAEV
jgi:hypothetical protein